MQRRIDLNGEWQLAWWDGQRGTTRERALTGLPDVHFRVTAQVPGEVHLDLTRAGVIGDPSTGLNTLSARWVEEMIWFYRRTFDAPALQPGERAWLIFDRLELAAHVWLNGEEVGSHANAFYPCRLDVTARLRPGENVLVVGVEAGLFRASQRPSEGYGMHVDHVVLRRNWLRNVQSSFAWDWAPRLLNVGLSGDAALEVASGVRFDRLVVLAGVSDDLREGRVTARVFAEGLVDAPLEGVLMLDVTGLPDLSHRRMEIPVTIQPGENRLEATLIVPNPALWWPAGHGAQPLYTVRATLRVGETIVADAERQVGFRRVRVNQDPHPLPQGGSYFIIEINDKPIFCKGGNLVPEDLIPARLDRARYEILVDRALEANCNLLRVWGGGVYESDDLYDICDARGVLMWQEFIFACAKYPTTDAEFLAEVKREARHQVRRLAHHPSLVVWCGNNEMEEGNYHWGYEQGVAHPDYALFHMVLPIILKEEDNTRYYQPSSPYSPDHESPRRADMGDQHPWAIGGGNTEFHDYRTLISRFPNEGGILGPTSLPTVLVCLPEGQRDPDAPAFPQGYKTGNGASGDALRALAWDAHENASTFDGEQSCMNQMIEKWVGRPIEEMTVADLVYWGGVVQGMGLHEYIRNFRRRMFSSASAIFWMYNDVWPAIRSWTIVDYYLRRTPSFYPVRRAFAPLAVFIAVEGDQVKVFGVNEGPAWAGELRYGLVALAGGYPVDEARGVALSANTSTLLATLDVAEWKRLGQTTHIPFALLSRESRTVSQDVYFPTYYREMRWPAAQVRAHRVDGKAIFESDAFAWRVCLDLDGEISLPDNFFDILPGIPTVLDWPDSLAAPRVLRVANGTV
jgi:beta-mannosidase